MNELKWIKPMADCIAFSGVIAILVGVLACQNYPFFAHFNAINCELGYYGLTIAIFGFVFSEWAKKSNAKRLSSLKKMG